MIQQAFRIPETTLGKLGHQVQGIRSNDNLLLLADPVQMPHQFRQRDAAEVEALAPGHDGGQNPLGICGGQHKNHPWRRLLQRFEESVEGCRGQHVTLVHHVDLPAQLYRRKTGPLDELSNVVHPCVGSRVNLDHVQSIASGNGDTGLTPTAWFCRRFRAAGAVEGTGQNAGT